MRLLKSLVIRNIQHAKTRRSDILENEAVLEVYEKYYNLIFSSDDAYS